MVIKKCKDCDSGLQFGKCVNRECTWFDIQQGEKPESIRLTETLDEIVQPYLANRAKESTILSQINIIVYGLSLLGALIIFISSFGQCNPGEGSCYDGDYTNFFQIGIGIASLLVSTLLWAVIDSFDKYVNR
jgi:hypothetical protein